MFIQRFILALSFTASLGISDAAEPEGFVALFPKDGPPAGFVVRHWADVSAPPEAAANWEVKDGILTSVGARGCWLMSEKEYGDFVLEYEFKLGPMGNSGCALRAPLRGDPAFDGMEMQMADFRYNEKAKDSELTGGIYRAMAPKRTRFTSRRSGTPCGLRSLAREWSSNSTERRSRISTLQRPRRPSCGTTEQLRRR